MKVIKYWQKSILMSTFCPFSALVLSMYWQKQQRIFQCLFLKNRISDLAQIWELSLVYRSLRYTLTLISNRTTSLWVYYHLKSTVLQINYAMMQKMLLKCELCRLQLLGRVSLTIVRKKQKQKQQQQQQQQQQTRGAKKTDLSPGHWKKK